MVGRVDSNQQILDRSLPSFSTLSCFTGTNMSGLFGSSYLQHKCSCFTLHVSIVRLSVFTSYSSLIRSHPDVSSIWHCTQIYKYTNVPYQISVPAFLRARLVRVSQILRSCMKSLLTIPTQHIFQCTICCRYILCGYL